MPIIKDDSCTRTNSTVLKNYIDTYKTEFCAYDIPIVLFVGRLVEVKNLGTLFRACALLRDEYHLLIVGDGPMRQQWQMDANNLNINCTFLGQKNDEELEAIYRIASVFALPSTMEAFGAVTNEALLAGCYCCISSNAGSACLIENGVNGYTFNPYNAEELAKKISYLLRREKKEESLMPNSFDTYMQELSLHLLRIQYQQSLVLMICQKYQACNHHRYSYLRRLHICY